MMKTLLITGASGSIGRKLRRQFAAMSNLDLRLLCINPGGDGEVTTADLSVYHDQWARVFDGADVLIHLAGASSPASNWETVQRLNIDLSLNVLRAAEAHGVKRIIFASSNWVMAGHRHRGDYTITSGLPPCPVNAYGASKLFIERAGQSLSARFGISFIGLRIGYCQHAEGNIPGAHMDHGAWGQSMWLSDRDLCHGMEKAVFAEDIQYAVLNLVSNNPGMRWDITETHRAIGYEPIDGHVAVTTPKTERQERLANLQRQFADELDEITTFW